MILDTPRLLTMAGLAVMLLPALSSAQPANPVSRGFQAAQYGGCRADVLSSNLALQKAAASVAVLATDAASRLFPNHARDPMTFLALNCAAQLHQHRCTEQIVAVLADVHLGAGTRVLAPRLRSIPSSASSPIVTGAKIGAGMGGAAGLLRGRPITGAIKGAIAGAAVGGAVEAIPAMRQNRDTAACLIRMQQLDAASRKLQGGPFAVAVNDFEELIDSNRISGAISHEEAGLLRDEALLLATKPAEIMDLLRQ